MARYEGCLAIYVNASKRFLKKDYEKLALSSFSRATLFPYELALWCKILYSVDYNIVKRLIQTQVSPYVLCFAVILIVSDIPKRLFILTLARGSILYLLNRICLFLFVVLIK